MFLAKVTPFVIGLATSKFVDGRRGTGAESGMENGSFSRQPDDGKQSDEWIRLPKPLVYSILGVVIASIGGGSWYMSHQADEIAHFSERLQASSESIDGLKRDIRDHNSEIDRRIQDSDAYERSMNDRLTRIEASITFLIKTNEATPSPVGRTPHQ